MDLIGKDTKLRHSNNIILALKVKIKLSKTKTVSKFFLLNEIEAKRELIIMIEGNSLP